MIEGYPEFALTDLVKQLDPTRLVDSTTGWYDHGAGDFSVSTFYNNNTNKKSFTYLLLRTTIIMPIPSVARHFTRLPRALTTLLVSDSRVNSEELGIMCPLSSKFGAKLSTVLDTCLLTGLNKSLEQPGSY